MTTNHSFNGLPRFVLATALFCLARLTPAMAGKVDDCGALVASPYQAGHEQTGANSLASVDLETAEKVCAMPKTLSSGSAKRNNEEGRS